MVGVDRMGLRWNGLGRIKWCCGQEGHMSDDVEPFPRDVLHVETRQNGSGATIVVVGEFDMTGTEQFWAHVSEAVEARPGSLTIEARRLTFIDSVGLAAIVRAREAATEAGVDFRVSGTVAAASPNS
jgi:anti-anti-sigma factor